MQRPSPRFSTRSLLVLTATLAAALSAALSTAGCDSGKEADAAKAAAPAKAEQQDRGEPKAGAPGGAAPAEKEAPPSKAEAEQTYGKDLCGTIIPCFEKLKFAGSFVADVTADIEPDGKVSAVSFTGDAPQPVQTCIIDAIKAMTVSPYNGKPGRTKCTQSGQLSGGTRMVMADSTYEIREPAP